MNILLTNNPLNTSKMTKIIIESLNLPTNINNLDTFNPSFQDMG